MALRNTRAYALRTYPLGEADLIVVFYCEDFGKLRGVARGARRVKSGFGSAFQSFTRSRLAFYEKEGRELVRVSGCEVERSYYHLLTNPEAAATAAYFAELLQEFTPERDANPAIFRLIGAVMESVARGTSLTVAARYFEVWVLRLSGLLPRLEVCGGGCGRRLEAGRWVHPGSLEFVCRACRGSRRGSRWLSPAGTALLRRILHRPPGEVADEAAADAVAVRRLAAVNRLLIRGHLGKELRSVRYLDRLRRGRRAAVAGSDA